MRSLLKFSALGLCLRQVFGAAVDLEKRDNITLKAPVVAEPSEHWEGVDGTWSTFEIRVGTPANVYRVLPATSWQETWVIYQDAYPCDESLGVNGNCADARGGLFSSAQSSTWVQTYANATLDQYSLGLNTDLGESGVGQYGFDTVGLGYTTNDGPTLTHQIVSEIYSQTWWFGILGLGFQPTNFTTYANPVPSFADTLYSNGTISSRSWSYTAGAYYALKTGMLGNLIFGGYDASRFTPNDVTFTMTEDNLRDIVVSVQSITSTTAHGNTTLMSSPELVFIDSTVPELWLPVEVCQQFEKAFGIALDPNSSTYLVNETTHNNLLSLNPNITLTLANQQTGGPTVDIVLPYAAFDMNVTAPILPNRTSYYFPLMQAANSSQYTLGRSFLQEAYVTADYNSRTFNVSQCIFDPSASAQVIAIPSVLPTASSTPGGGGGNTASTTGSSGKKLSGGDIAGIVIGVLLFFAVVGSVVACCLTGVLCFPSRKKDKDSTRPSTPPVAEIGGTRIPKGTGPFPTAYSEQASAFTSEVDGQDAKVEIQGNPIMHPQELEAEVPMLPGNVAAGKTNGPSDSSNDTGVSSLSPIRENGPGRTPMAELGAQERGLGYGSVGLEDRDNYRNRDTIVSPASEGPGRDSMMGRARGAGAGSPTLSSPSEGTGTMGAAGWTPSTPVQRAASGSRFEEHWEDERNG